MAYVNRGIAYYQRSSFSNAINDFSKTIELDNREPGVYLLRGNAYYSKREYRQAINDYNKALEINPDYYAAYNYRSDLYSMMGNMVEYKNDRIMAEKLNLSIHNAQVESRALMYLRETLGHRVDRSSHTECSNCDSSWAEITRGSY
ncbi:MAG: tetratricopeptide repeat protein [Desulfatiglans sp.]|nr:tetratricopeptide repeat protein [Desulfatiglans sp.]